MEFKPGISGNPVGRPKGCTRRTELYNMCRDNADAIIDTTIRLALSGDTVALKLCLERILPKLKDTISFKMPSVKDKSTDDVLKEIFESIEGQEVTLDEVKNIFEISSKHKTDTDSDVIKDMIAKSNVMLEELRAKNEREY